MVTAESKARVSFVTVQVTSIHYLFHLFGNNPKERPLLLRTLAAPCRWETLGSFLDVSFYILSPFLLSRFFSIGIWRLHYFLRFVSLAKRKESLRTLAKQHDRGYRHLRDIGAAWRELRQTIYRPVKTAVLFPSIWERRSSRAVTPLESPPFPVSFSRQRWFADVDVDEASGDVSFVGNGRAL